MPTYRKALQGTYFGREGLPLEDDTGSRAQERPGVVMEAPPVLPDEQPGYFELLSGGFRENTFAGAILKTHETRETGRAVDRSFEPDAFMKEQKISGYSEQETTRMVEDSVSAEHLLAIKAEIDETKAYQQQLAATGMATAFSSTILSGIFDIPTMLAAPIEAAALTRSIKSAMAIGAITNVTQEALIDHLTQNRTAQDYVISAAAPLLLTGIPAAGLAIPRATRRVMEAGSDLVEEARHMRLMDAVDAIRGVDTRGVKDPRGFGEESVGAATPKGTKFTTLTSNASEQVGIPKQGDTKAQRGWFLTTFGSDYSAFTKFGTKAHEYMDKFLSDPIGTGGVEARKVSASLTRERTERQLLQEVMPTMLTSLRRFQRKVPGQAGHMEFDKRLQFELNQRMFGSTVETDRHILKAADAWERARKLEFELGKKHGIEKFQNIDNAKSTYMEQLWDQATLFKFKNAGKEAEVISLISKGIQRGNMKDAIPDVKTADAIAKAIVRRMTAKYTGVTTRAAHMVPKDAKEFIEQVVKESDLDDVQKASITKILNPAENKQVTILDLDTYSDELGIGLQDLLDNNISYHIHGSLKESAGHIAYATQGIKSEADWAAMRKVVIEEQLAVDPSDSGKRAAERLGNMMDMHRKLMLGKPTEDNPAGLDSTILRRLRETMGLVSLNQMGFAQLSETARIIASVGLESLVKDAKIYKEMFSLKGPQLDEFLRDIQDSGFGGIGNGHFLNPRNYRTDEVGDFDGTLGSLGKRFDHFTAQARVWQGRYSGMDTIMGHQQAMAIRSICNKMYREATGSTQHGEIFRKRLRDMTLSDEDIDAVFKSMKTHATKDADSDLASTLNVGMWDDGLKDRFFNALEQHTHQVIQKDLVGEAQWWWGTTVAKSLAQFRKFPVVATEKLMLHDLKFADVEAAAALMYGILLSTSVYYAKSKLNAVGRPDAEEYMERRMSGTNLATGAFGYVGSLGVLPDAVRGVGDLMVGNAWTTRSGGAPIASLPGRFRRGIIGTRKLINPFEDAKYADFNAAVGMTGVNNIIFLRTVFNLIGNTVEQL